MEPKGVIKNVEGGKVIKGKLCLFGWNGGEGCALADTTLL